ncbi:ClpX C4-type zinc finger protein [Planomonospora venezuelensis]|uniref:ATP-dependent Clp protease ATP-binding subunit ClpX n=1 Tax=Planomonospora venezuelensis TaxID=1999 RepID=A0A841DBT1_PLAVE|nr:ClpX C4-type zinc finger protein [Planomonospora venezuelensis]MBB5965748.1 ATP-dependent Clp protease ATP-binding subunit ClpX [Planomonospora venezuelensis]GIN04402.1 hypothetical protein Pve01_60600 [Planomonospora venezuelensis]
MAASAPAGQQVHCSFCAKTDAEVNKLIAGPGVHICDGCVQLCNDILGQEAASPAAPAIPWPDTMTDEQMLDHLPRVAAVSAQVDADLQTWVGRLRARGVTWARIGAALGMTRQSAWERFSGEE